VDDRAAAPAPPVATPSLPGGPTYSLSGIAATDGPDGVHRTAIISDGHGLLYATAGETLPGGYTVIDVLETMVLLRDPAGAERTLRLR
jgi:hypothetical protein